jgi:hypothetical protein
MGRPKRYRERIRFEMHSVAAKDVRAVMERTLRAEFGRSRIEAEVLASRSLDWLEGLGAGTVPGQVRLGVPAGRSRRYAPHDRRVVTVTAVDVGEDTKVWEEFGLAAMQRRRVIRWLCEIHRQGGWASLKEVAAWANLTPTALGARLRPVRELGVWLPHIGAPPAGEHRLGPEAWLVDRFLESGSIESVREVFGLTAAAWEAVLRRFVTTLELARTRSPEEVSSVVARSPEEVRQFLAVGRRHRRRRALKELCRAYGGAPAAERCDIQAELVEQYGFSRVSARLYHEWLRGLAVRTGTEALPEGMMVFFAIDAAEGARARLAEARHVPVRLSYFTDADLARGPGSETPTRVAALKFGRICRYAAEARAQGALLSLPDLAVLMGMHVDAIRRHISAHPEVIVPTRGRVKDIGRGVSHKARIVELYLQMHTETEIVERTGHSYESVETYLREFARVLTLADRGLNAVMIRRVTGRSMSLIQAYLDLRRRYDEPEYHFRLAQMRRVFARDEATRGEKRGPSPSRTGGVTP